jgi:hypothetical protein
MKLGLIRLADQHCANGARMALDDTLKLAAATNVELAYLPKVKPQQAIAATSNLPSSTLKIGLDAGVFSTDNPRDLERAVRAANADLGGKLCIGLTMSNAHSSVKSRTQAQTFETVFSHTQNNTLACKPSPYPMRAPCPEVLGLPATGTTQETARAAACGYRSLTPSWLPAHDVARHWPAIVSGATSALLRARPSFWHLARTIVIHDDPAIIDAYIYGARSPIRAYYTALARAGLIEPDVDKTLKHVVISGSCEQVTDHLLSLSQAVGKIGTLHLVDHAGSDAEMSRNTLMQLAENVMPLVAKTRTGAAKEMEKV